LLGSALLIVLLLSPAGCIYVGEGGGGGNSGGGPTDPCAGVTGTTYREYYWRYHLEDWQLSYYLPNYLICRSQHAAVPRKGAWSGFAQLITWPEDDQLILQFARTVNSVEGGLTDYYEIATNTLHFVQGMMPYVSDIGEYWQLPVETLYRKGGDCEDGAILYVALLKSLNFPVFFGVYPGTSNHPGHAFAFVEVSYEWVEAQETKIFNKCLLMNCWTVLYDPDTGRCYAMAETTIDPNIMSLGYWGLGCGSLPQDCPIRMIDPTTGRDITPPYWVRI